MVGLVAVLVVLGTLAVAGPVLEDLLRAIRSVFHRRGPMVRPDRGGRGANHSSHR